MKWLRAVVTDAVAAPRLIADIVFGARCQITGERTYPRDRHWHQRYEHPTDGACND